MKTGKSGERDVTQLRLSQQLRGGASVHWCGLPWPGRKFGQCSQGGPVSCVFQEGSCDLCFTHFHEMDTSTEGFPASRLGLRVGWGVGERNEVDKMERKCENEILGIAINHR